MAYMKIEDGKEILVLEQSDFDNAVDLDDMTTISENCIRGGNANRLLEARETRELLHIEKIILDSILKGEE